MNNKQHNNMKNRQRGRNGGKPRPGGGGGGRNPNFDGNNNGRMRGNAQQLMEKFLAMARDATSSGDRVLAENYFQHADHYYRVLNARFEQQGGQHNNQNNNGNRPYQGGNDRGEDGGDYQGSSEQAFQPQQRGYQQPPQSPQQHQQHQPHQPQVYAQEPQQQPQIQPQPEPQPQDRDIGLPPGILGITPEASPEPQGDAVEAEKGEGAESRTRPQGRRRRGPRERAPADAGAE